MKARRTKRHALRTRRLSFEPLEERSLLAVALLAQPPLAEPPAAVATEQPAANAACFASAEELKQFLLGQALEQYKGSFGQTTYWPVWGGYYLDSILNFRAEAVLTLAGNTHSETNVQVAGVDEADLVETDGDYLYVLGQNEMRIIDVRTPGMPEMAARVTLESAPRAMYLAGDRLVILSSGADANETRVSVFDVADRRAPRLVQQTDIEGSLIDSRLVDGALYLVLSNSIALPPPEQIELPDDPGDPAAVSPAADPSRPLMPAMIWMPPAGGKRYVYETQEQYLARVGDKILDLALPNFSSRGPDGRQMASGLLHEATQIYRPLAENRQQLASVVVFDVASDSPGPASSVAVPTRTAVQVYASAQSLYLFSSNCVWSDSGATTEIVKLNLDPANHRAERAAGGSVPGSLLNQFSADERDGYLRIAVTTGFAWTYQNAIYTLRQQGEQLEIAGRLEHLTPTERIYSARFLGDTAFLVTFIKMDPLLAVDLTDPTAPTLKGDLVLPGFSNYLQAIDGDFLIGVGRDANVQTGLYADPQVSLFDVHDLSDPALLDRYTLPIGRAGGASAFDDHHVIAYYPEQHVLAFSVGDQGQTDLWVFQIDPVRGESGSATGSVKLLGRVDHTSAIQRSVQIGDYLYAISTDLVSVHPILDPSSTIAELPADAPPLMAQVAMGPEPQPEAAVVETAVADDREAVVAAIAAELARPAADPARSELSPGAPALPAAPVELPALTNPAGPEQSAVEEPHSDVKPSEPATPNPAPEELPATLAELDLTSPPLGLP